MEIYESVVELHKSQRELYKSTIILEPHNSLTALCSRFMELHDWPIEHHNSIL